MELTGDLVPYLAAGVSMPPFCKRAWHGYDTTKFALMEELSLTSKPLRQFFKIRAPILSAFAELIPFRETDSLYAIVSML
ncbi:MAG: hypothetical protein COU08_00660 [Candidatus Harrisonbacteria bacterium CG10_big_fil_rev_8_21_14_0_10_42_17]|uniref:Uncharacterized protein n=1 Tax=Candidatus Harrisonbacteria bacterium CG10_big_fil_rev_8_21_14_0_10_42_17 TaxID=1974584 RepID=A0A2M6WJ31_9BACT|nr:MAG: hypothetical protein COU08_00660 [Candidatus Harrisonbacteria bacterium CG10_big_fil_rev_8_21_14_0_10_42_17]